MVNNKMSIIICCCLIISTANAMQLFSTDFEQSPALNVVQGFETRRSFDALSVEEQSAIYAAIDSVTFGKGEPRPEIISSGFIISDIKDTISEVIVGENETIVYFPSAKAYRVKLVKDDISEFIFFDAGSITIRNGGEQVILNERKQ